MRGGRGYEAHALLPNRETMGIVVHIQEKLVEFSRSCKFLHGLIVMLLHWFSNDQS